MGTPTRFPGGLNTSAPTTNTSEMGQLDPSKYATFFDDLFVPAAALGTFTAISGDGGLVTVATTNDLSTPQTSFVGEDSKKLFFKTKLSTSVVATGGAIAGFVDTFPSAAAGITVTVLNNVLTLTNAYDSVTDTATVTYAVNEMFEIGLSYVPGKGVAAYFNDECVARVATPTFDTTALVAGVYSNGGTLTIDYILAAKER